MHTCQKMSRRQADLKAIGIPGETSPRDVLARRAVLARGAGRGPPGPPQQLARPALAASRAAVRGTVGAARRPAGGDERLGTSVGRHLAAKVDLTDIAYLEQLETRSDPERDPRGRVLATAYLALVSADVEPRIPADTAWHRSRSSRRPRSTTGRSPSRAGPAAGQAVLHQHRLRPGPADVHDRPATGHLRRLGRPPVSATNLQRILTRRGVIEATPAAARPTSAGGRPAALPVRGSHLIVTNPFAAFRPPSAPRTAAS